MDIHEVILTTLQDRDLTQKGLANAIGVSSSTLNNWLKLGRDIPSQYIIPICEFIGVSTDYILTGKEAKKKSVPELTEDEQKVLNYYGSLKEEQKDYVKGEMARLNMANRQDVEISEEQAT